MEGKSTVSLQTITDHAVSQQASVQVTKGATMKQQPQTDTEEQSGNCCADPGSCCHRTQMYLLMCLLSVGTYYVYAIPVSLQKTIITLLDIDVTTYSLLYSVYSWPNIILALFGSYLLNRVFGLRSTTVLCSSFVCVGQFLFLLGAAFGNFTVMVLGRFVIGLGGEVLAISQVTYTVIWFKGKKLPLFLGFLLSFARTGSGLSLGLNQKLYDGFVAIPSPYVRLGAVQVFGLLFCIVSLVAAIVLGLLDKRARKILDKEREPKPVEIFSFKHIIDFPFRLWVVILLCVFYYITVFPFIGLAQLFLVEKYAVTVIFIACILINVIYLVASFFTQTMGKIMQWTGYHLTWVTAGVVLTFIAHAMLAFLSNTFVNLIIALLILGLGYTFVSCAVWPLVAHILPSNQLGTAYGIMQAVQHLGVAVAVIVGGAIVDLKGYFLMEVFFFFCVCAALGAGITLHALDAGSDGKLNALSRHRTKNKEERENEGEGEKETSTSLAEVPYHIRPLTRACTHMGVLK